MKENGITESFGKMFFLTTFIIPWDSGNTTDLLANITGVITDLTPLLTIIIGIGIGLIVVSAIISAIRGHS